MTAIELQKVIQKHKKPLLIESGAVTVAAEPTVTEVLKAVAAGAITPEQAAGMLPRSNGNGRSLSCKVSPKGAVSVLGLNSRWPTTLYADQWERLNSFMPTVLEFIKANSSELKRKVKV